MRVLTYIPGALMSNGSLLDVMRPCGCFVVAGVGFEAAVEDAYEPVDESTLCSVPRANPGGPAGCGARGRGRIGQLSGHRGPVLAYREPDRWVCARRRRWARSGRAAPTPDVRPLRFCSPRRGGGPGQLPRQPRRAGEADLGTQLGQVHHQPIGAPLARESEHDQQRGEHPPTVAAPHMPQNQLHRARRSVQRAFAGPRDPAREVLRRRAPQAPKRRW